MFFEFGFSFKADLNDRRLQDTVEWLHKINRTAVPTDKGLDERSKEMLLLLFKQYLDDPNVEFYEAHLSLEDVMIRKKPRKVTY